MNFFKLLICIDMMLFFALHLICMSHIFPVIAYCIKLPFWVTVISLSPLFWVGSCLAIFSLDQSKKVIMSYVQLAIGRECFLSGGVVYNLLG